MPKLNIPIQSQICNYSVTIESGLVSNLKQVILSDLKYDLDQLIFLCDQNTKFILDNEFAQAKIISIPAGENSKLLSVAESVWARLLELQADRHTCLVAVGGGVVGDLAGFVASTFMRGIKFVNVPTTLIAQVDSAIGGKTGINLAQGKNLIGTFYPPKIVLVDPDLLDSLDFLQVRSGLAEMFKYGLIKNKTLFEQLENACGDLSQIKNLIAECIKIKAQIVIQDEFEFANERVLLNLGHTVGHALERSLGYGKITHGQAVAAGILLELAFAVEQGIASIATYETVKIAFQNSAILPQSQSVVLNKDQITNLIKVDKKRKGSKIKLPLILQIGQAKVYDIEIDQFVIPPWCWNW